MSSSSKLPSTQILNKSQCEEFILNVKNGNNINPKTGLTIKSANTISNILKYCEEKHTVENTISNTVAKTSPNHNIDISIDFIIQLIFDETNLDEIIIGKETYKKKIEKFYKYINNNKSNYEVKYFIDLEKACLNTVTEAFIEFNEKTSFTHNEEINELTKFKNILEVNYFEKLTSNKIFILNKSYMITKYIIQNKIETIIRDLFVATNTYHSKQHFLHKLKRNEIKIYGLLYLINIILKHYNTYKDLSSRNDYFHPYYDIEIISNCKRFQYTLHDILDNKIDLDNKKISLLSVYSPSESSSSPVQNVNDKFENKHVSSAKSESALFKHNFLVKSKSKFDKLEHIKKFCFNQEDPYTLKRFEEFSKKKLNNVVMLGVHEKTGKSYCFYIKSLFTDLKNLRKNRKNIYTDFKNPLTRKPFTNVEIEYILREIKLLYPKFVGIENLLKPRTYKFKNEIIDLNINRILDNHNRLFWEAKIVYKEKITLSNYTLKKYIIPSVDGIQESYIIVVILRDLEKKGKLYSNNGIPIKINKVFKSIEKMEMSDWIKNGSIDRVKYDKFVNDVLDILRPSSNFYEF